MAQIFIDGRRWRHKKRGSTYIEIGRGRLQSADQTEDMRVVVIYMSEDDDSIWVRPVPEFEDGRFEPVKP